MFFEKFIIAWLKYYGLDLCHYFSSPRLSWYAMLKTTEIEFKLILDIDMHLLIEKGMRGGILYIAKRNSKANNKYMTNYGSSKEIKSIVYLDADNFYGCAISQYLPYGEFKWLKKNWSKRNW